MFKGLSNLASMVKQAQQMGSKLQEINEQLKAQRVSGAAGGGMIEVEANGIGEILRVRIESQLIEKQDRELIEDLLPAAINQALTKAKQLHAEALRGITGGMNLPGLDEALEGLKGQ